MMPKSGVLKLLSERTDKAPWVTGNHDLVVGSFEITQLRFAAMSVAFLLIERP